MFFVRIVVQIIEFIIVDTLQHVHLKSFSAYYFYMIDYTGFFFCCFLFVCLKRRARSTVSTNQGPGFDFIQGHASAQSRCASQLG